MHVHRSVSVNHTVGSWTMAPVSVWLLCSVTRMWLRESPGTFPGAILCKVSGNPFRLKGSLQVKGGVVSEFISSPGKVAPHHLHTHTHTLFSLF